MTKATCAAFLAADQNVFAYKNPHAYTVADHMALRMLKHPAGL